MIKIIDNFLPEVEFRNIQNSMLSTSWPWYFNDIIVDEDEQNDPTKFQFIHAFFLDWNWVGSGEKIIYPLTRKINPCAWVRIKANLSPRTPENRMSSYHIDLAKMNNIPFETAIYYINTNNGKTFFEDGTTVESVENRLVVFPGNTMHTGCTCTDQSRRVLINLNYIKPEFTEEQ